jgi:hypothetical protein
MSEGILTINYHEPAYIGFSRSGSAQQSLRYCSQEEIRELLHALGLISDDETLHCRDIILRIPIHISDSQLQQIKLAA